MQITVNGIRHDIPRGHISYEAVASLAGYPDAKELTVVYRGPRVGDVQRSGTLIPGLSVACDDGMIFNAVYTGNA